METKLSHLIVFVSDMEQSIAYYRDVLGLPLKSQSPYWSEFNTGETSLALHPATAVNPAGKIEIGFHVGDLQAFYQERLAKGGTFIRPPTLEGKTQVALYSGPDGLELHISGG